MKINKIEENGGEKIISLGSPYIYLLLQYLYDLHKIYVNILHFYSVTIKLK